MSAAPAPAETPIRLDKWLVVARFFKTRAMAAGVIEAGRMRVNGQPVTRIGRPVGPGDVLTFAQGTRIRVVRILATAERRGPAAVAQGLYADLDAPAASSPETG